MRSYPVLRGDLIASPILPRLIGADGVSHRLHDDPDLVPALKLLDGHHTWNEVRAALPNQADATHLIDWLTENRLVRTTRPRPLHGLQIRLYGSNRLATALASRMLSAGSSKLIVVDSTAEYSPTRNAYSSADQLIERLRLTPPMRSRVQIDRHWVCGEEQVNIAVIAGPGIQPDRAVLEDLRIQQIPTLVVSAHHDFARVGPLYCAGISCWRCVDAAATSCDPEWPRCVAALSGRLTSPVASAAEWATVCAMSQLTSFALTGTCDLTTGVLCWDGARPGLYIADEIPSCSCATQQ